MTNIILTLSPYHLVTPSPCHRVTLSPLHPVILPPPHPVTKDFPKSALLLPKGGLLKCPIP